MQKDRTSIVQNYILGVDSLSDSRVSHKEQTVLKERYKKLDAPNAKKNILEEP